MRSPIPHIIQHSDYLTNLHKCPRAIAADKVEGQRGFFRALCEFQILKLAT